VKEFDVVEKGFQMIINPFDYNCVGFLKYLRRSTKDQKKNRELSYLPYGSEKVKSEVESGHERLSSLVSEMPKSYSCTERTEASYRNTLLGLTANILKTKIPNSHEIKDRHSAIEGNLGSNLCEKWENIGRNRLVSLMNHRHSWASSVIKFLRSVRRPNTFIVVDTSNFESKTILALNSRTGTFKKTFMKTFVIGDGRQDEEDYMRDKGYKVLVKMNDSNKYKLYSNEFELITYKYLNSCISLSMKAIVKACHMLENRWEIYRQNPFIAQQEINWALSFFLIDRQQFSVVADAVRYLHASSASSYCEPKKIIAKMQGIRLKYMEEVIFLNSLMSCYSAVAEIKERYGLNAMRLENKVYPMCLPDMLFASRDFSYNVSSYSVNNIINIEKQDDILSAEAECMRAIFEQVENEKNAIEENHEFFVGMRDWQVEKIIDWSKNNYDVLHMLTQDILRSVEDDSVRDNRKRYQGMCIELLESYDKKRSGHRISVMFLL
jgi:hypothetical protein